MVNKFKWFVGLFKALDRFLLADGEIVDQILQLILIADILEASINTELFSVVLIYEAHWVIRQGHSIVVFVKFLHDWVRFVDIECIF